MATNNEEQSVNTGSEGCKCINQSAILASLGEDRQCQTLASSTTIEVIGSSPSQKMNDGVLITVAGGGHYCVPFHFGSNICLNYQLHQHNDHDRHHHHHHQRRRRRQQWINNDPNCNEDSVRVGTNVGDSVEEKHYCDRPWCYVDAKSCMVSSTERLYRSTYFAFEEGLDLFYSYTTCDSSLDDYSRTQHRKHTLGGITITATSPTAYLPPYMYKKDPSTGNILTMAGDEYYDNSVPYQGVLVHYLNELQDLANGDFKIHYTFGSKASKLVHPTSAFTAAVQDIEDGLVDMAVSPFWVTGERLRMTSVTVPLYYSRLMLVIPDPGKNDSFRAQANRVFEPFNRGTWTLIIFVVIFTALLSVWFSDRSRDERWVRYGKRGLRRARPPNNRRAIGVYYARRALDSFLEKGMFFCSAGVEQERGASLPSKFLMFGFGGFILIVISAYMANLAALLIRSEYPYYVGTMDGVVAKGKKVCALPALEKELEIAWPSAHFVFSEYGQSYYGLLDDYDAKLCDFIAVGQTDVTSSVELMDMFCERHLVFTNSLIIENQVALPIRPELAAGLSYWMYQGEKYHGISVEASLEKYKSYYNMQANCDITIGSTQETKEGDYAHITPKNLFIPFIFFLAFAVLAAILQLYNQWASKEGNSINPRLPRRLSGLGLQRFLNRGGLDNACNDARLSCETPDVVEADPDAVLQKEFNENSLGHKNERNESLSNRKEITSYRLGCVLKESDKNYAGYAVGGEDVNLLSGEDEDAGNATSQLRQLVETGAFDGILAYVQKIKKQKKGS